MSAEPVNGEPEPVNGEPEMVAILRAAGLQGETLWALVAASAEVVRPRALEALTQPKAPPDTAYRPGLPSVEQVRAHEARGGVWMRWSVGGTPLIEVLAATGDEVTDVVGEPWLPGGSSWRPCLPDGTPCPWPEAQL